MCFGLEQKKLKTEKTEKEFTHITIYRYRWAVVGHGFVCVD
jgi:hypothetical protein